MSTNACVDATGTQIVPFTKITDSYGQRMSLVYMNGNPVAAAIGAATQTFFALLSDSAGDYWVMRILVSGNNFNQQEWHKIGSISTGATDIKNATHFATGGPSNSNLYYAVDGKI